MNIKTFLFLSVLILLSPSRFGSELQFKKFMVVWNVGQGQWATLKDANGCHHFDMGGEKNPIKYVTQLCRGLSNFVYLSHWDWDHISFVRKSASALTNRCLMLGPVGTSSERKMNDVATLKKCDTKISKELLLLSDFTKGLPKNSNDASHVLLAKNKFLIPGDSGKSEEKRWAKASSISQAKWLLLGHHGSRTSTSKELLSRLPHLKVAIASARSRRYGHPHIQVQTQLKVHHIPLLRTEDWGHLWFELSE